jgi:molybdenum cofactor guanylyltransferase
MTKRAALILAGGKARRFQRNPEEWQDKALAELHGKPLLIHVAENALGVVDDVVVCVNDDARKTRYSHALARHGLDKVRLVVDEKISHIGGPIVAIMTGLKSTKAEFCVTLPCDMPLLKPNIIEYLFDVAGNAQVAVPIWPSGRLETLVMVLEKGSALEITQTLCQLKRPRSDDIMRGASKVLFVSPVGEMRALDPELKSFVNINRHEDLAKLQTRPARGLINENLRATLGALIMPEMQRLRNASELCGENKFAQATTAFSSCAANLETEKSFFWAGVSRENEGEALLAWSQLLQKEPENASELDFRGRDAFLAAGNNYRQEAEVHLEARCRFLAERAWADKTWCEGWVMCKTGQSNRYPSKY